MKISTDTLTLLANFASINSNIVLHPGNQVKTISPRKNLYAVSTIDELITKDAAIWDLNQFLAIVSVLEDPDFTFHDKYVEIKSGRNKIIYKYAEAGLITDNDKKFTMPAVTHSFTLTAKDLKNLQKAANILGMEDFVLEGEGKEGALRLLDKKDVSSNSFNVAVEVTCKMPSVKYRSVLSVANMKMLPDDYVVDIADNKVASFIGDRAIYYVALEPDSTFDGSGE